MTEEILGFLQKTVVEYKEQVELNKLSSVRIGARANFVAYPDNEEKLIELVRFLRKNKIRHKILGRMTNVLPGDNFYDGVVIKTDRLNGFFINNDKINVSSGVSLPRLSRIAAEASLMGLEKLSGIPGSVGGAISGNAGAYGREISELVISVRVLDMDTGSVHIFKSEDMSFAYRSSLVDGKDYVILSAELGLTPSDRCWIYSAMRRYSHMRRESQPVDKPSLGSVFKRPSPCVYPWKLIDGVGLRGFRIGDAQVSEKHAGFIINLGNAKSSDFLSVVEQVEQSVFSTYGIRLSREFKIL